jgi:hypothetical protein
MHKRTEIMQQNFDDRIYISYFPTLMKGEFASKYAAYGTFI